MQDATQKVASFEAPVKVELRATVSKIALFFPSLLKPQDFGKLVEQFDSIRNPETFDEAKSLKDQEYTIPEPTNDTQAWESQNKAA